MQRTIRVEGPATQQAMWAAYAHTSRWPEWAPHLQRVVPEAPLEPGLTGVVTGWLGVHAGFEITEVDPEAGTWSWKVKSGPIRLRLDHATGEGWTSLTVHGPPWVMPYLPLARLALRRLVRI